MSSSSKIPPLDKIFLIGLWIGVVLEVQSQQQSCASCHLAPVVQVCVTIHVSTSLRQGLEAFIYTPPGAGPDYASLYFAQEGATLAATKNGLYTTAVFIQDLLLIWRMYIVWTRNWKIIVIPLGVELFHMGCAYAAVVILTQPDQSIYTAKITTLGSLGWPLELVVNARVTGAIASRLWYMGRVVSRAAGTGSTGISKNNAYTGPILTIIESWAILIALTFVMLVLYKAGNPAALMCTDIATQISALVPYLIIVRVGLGLTHTLPNAYKSYKETNNLRSLGGSSGMRFAPNRLFGIGTKTSQSGPPQVAVTISETITSTANDENIVLS
ncbi:hypothetical protein GSI_11731 [Ganoderma sinense ZZ0214-1]|uniref:Transporter n=1 Tax=Ganoderma sinense ZZ0214-1 TaxID=1077348 RepID=A0A2G8RWV9_9APHY|nr:hypothetical protein GSI_11731 [Ganoderma sinense ZZ0214-1]